MEENNVPAPLPPSEKTGCINCENPVVVKGYPNALCEDCRKSFIKFPIPLWIKLFAGGIGLIFLFSLYKIPRNIEMGVHMEKGKTASEEKKYMTAQKELQFVVDKAPDNVEAQSYLLIAAFQNQDFLTMQGSYEKLKDKKIDDEYLFDQIQKTLDRSVSYFSNDLFDTLLHKYDNDLTKIPDPVLKEFTDSNSLDIYAIAGFASKLVGENNYVAADSMLKKAIGLEPDYWPALSIMSSVKRLEGQTDESIAYCNKMLDINKESVFALASKARTLLKAKKDNEALSIALQSYNLDEKDAYAAGTLLLVYHFLNKTQEKEMMLKKVALLKDSDSQITLQYVKDIMQGKENFRN